MITTALSGIIAILQSHSMIFAYLIIFLIMCAEGPIVTYVAALAASFGYLNIWIVLILSFLGGVIPDSILYFVGKFARTKAVEKAVLFFGISDKRMKWIEKNFKKHAIKTIIAVKLIPPLPIPGLILSGYMKIPFKKFILTSSITNIFGVLFFLLLGFYSGIAVSNFLKYLKMSEFIIPILVILLVGVYFLSRFISSKLSKVASKI